MKCCEKKVCEPYRKFIGRETSKVLQDKKAKGLRYTRILPFGYDLAEDKKRLKQNPTEQTRIDQIICCRKKGMSYRDIVKYLDIRGWRNKYGRKIGLHIVSKVINNWKGK